MLYEMATGKRAFQKKTAIDTLAAILNEEPEPIAQLNPQVPAPLRWIVERCLSKEPRGRYESTGDLAKDLASVRDRLSEVATSGERAGLAAPRRGSRTALLLALLALALVGGASFWLGLRKGEHPPPSFRRLTFRRGTMMNARFTPDGQSVVYSAAWDGNPAQLYTTRLDNPAFQRLSLPSADLFSVSRSGELAIGLGSSRSTLARVPLSGGGPREVLENATSAAWSPDGSSLAVAYVASGKFHLEYPIGRKLYETTGWMHIVRVSPDGERVAFADHPRSTDARGSVAVVDRAGKKTNLTAEIPLMVALAWSPRGDEVWYSAPDNSIRGVSLSGRERVVFRSAGGGGLEDVAPDGRALLSQYLCRTAVIGVPAGQTQERDLSWFDASAAADLSADGRTLLFRESGQGSSSALNDAYTRKLDGSDPVRLGIGDPRALSPDGKSALVVLTTSPPSLEVLPTGAGEKRLLERGEVTEYSRVANWFPDGKRIFFEGVGKDSLPRIYTQSLDGGPPEPLTEASIVWDGPFVWDGPCLRTAAFSWREQTMGAGSVSRWPRGATRRSRESMRRMRRSGLRRMAGLSSWSNAATQRAASIAWTSRPAVASFT